MDLERIKQIVDLIEKSSFNEFTLTEGEDTITLKRTASEVQEQKVIKNNEDAGKSEEQGKEENEYFLSPLVVAVGAHPGFPDLMGFGRRNMTVSVEEAKAYITYQLGALYAFCKSLDMPIQHVKPHGAMYNMAGKDYKLARGICEAIYEFDSDIILLGLSGSELINAAKEIGLRAANEFFADRAYEDDGSLVARTKEGAMITDEDEAIHRVIRGIKKGKVRTISGRDINIHIDSICVHGDDPKAVDFVKCIREALSKEGITLCPLNKLV